MSEEIPAAAPRTTGLPQWARAADYVALLLLLLAATIGISGGFRTHIGGWPLALTAPLRLVLAAGAVVTARLVLIRTDWMLEHVTARLAGAARSVPLRRAAAVVFGTRMMIFAVGYLAVIMFGYAPGAQPFETFKSELLNLPLRWDAGWYLQIATDGYAYIESAGATAQQNIVFFPAYPMIVRGVARLCGNSMVAYAMGATVASTTLFFVGLMYVYRLARESLTDDQATTAIWLLAAYPFALFYGAIYTEGLYLAAAAGALYHFRRRELGRAAVWGLIIGLTRPNGFLLTLPLALVAVEQWRLWCRSGTSRHFTFVAASTALTPVVGVLFYSVFVGVLTGHPFAWAAGHAAWGRHYAGLTHLVADRYGFIASRGILEYVSRQPYDWMNACGAIFVLLAAWPVGRRFGYAYAAFIVLNMLPPLAAGGFMSAGRFSSVLFPAFLWLAVVIPAAHRPGWIATFAAAQAFNAALFYTWRPLN